MAEGESKRAQGVIAGCPWCGDGTPLTFKGDGFGGVSLCCLKCNCRGPAAPIESDFSEADDNALASWSARSAIDGEVLSRVKMATELATLLNGGKTSPATEVPVRLGDLVKIIRISKPDWLRSPG
jgi:hypothetical protein